MTINKSQGQSVEYIGTALTRPVFAHDQLYVTLSKGQDRAKIRVVLDDTLPGPRGEVRIIVYTMYCRRRQRGSESSWVHGVDGGVNADIAEGTGERCMHIVG
jgi:hypothetical protein